MNIKKIALLGSVLILHNATMYPKYKKSKKTEVIHQHNEPLLFDVQDGSTGHYWPGYKNETGKAFIGEIEYKNVIAVPEDTVARKKQGMVFLGMYTQISSDGAINITYNLYGQRVHPETEDDAPDADVMTIQDIKEEFGNQ